MQNKLSLEHVATIVQYVNASFPYVKTQILNSKSKSVTQFFAMDKTCEYVAIGFYTHAPKMYHRNWRPFINTETAQVVNCNCSGIKHATPALALRIYYFNPIPKMIFLYLKCMFPVKVHLINIAPCTLTLGLRHYLRTPTFPKTICDI